MSTDEDPDPRDGEAARLYRARCRWFLEAGFTLGQARVLADQGADHHEAEDLLKMGCPVAEAFDILV